MKPLLSLCPSLSLPRSNLHLVTCRSVRILTESVIVLLQVTFEQDVILSQANEYEVLQLLLGECKTRLGGYAGAP